MSRALCWSYLFSGERVKSDPPQVLGSNVWPTLGTFQEAHMLLRTRPVLESGTLKKLEHSLLHNPGTKQFYRLLFKTCVYNLLLNLYWE